MLQDDQPLWNINQYCLGIAAATHATAVHGTRAGGSKCHPFQCRGGVKDSRILLRYLQDVVDGCCGPPDVTETGAEDVLPRQIRYRRHHARSQKLGIFWRRFGGVCRRLQPRQVTVERQRTASGPHLIVLS